MMKLPTNNLYFRVNNILFPLSQPYELIYIFNSLDVHNPTNVLSIIVKCTHVEVYRDHPELPQFPFSIFNNVSQNIRCFI